ncbi:hypothetical protein EDD16DRAFT_1701719 [Pisolithus croceorrhizus]|nr:hypothetical protein EV401DRAFT_2072999 [Pisolithus croceorrhizus]KAI6128681.1 hypothetical protein EDD16DRAFT_1701719 [Pisolithus croceorrhizus]
MSNRSFRLTPRMINEEALRLLSQYAVHAITLEVAMDEIKYILQSNFDEEEWMAITHCVLMDPLCFADVEAEFLERLAERGSSIATAGPSLKDPSILRMPNSAAEDHDNEVGSLLKDPAAWRIMMDWAQDKIEYPDFDDKIRGFGAWYIHAEWQPLINAIFVLSDPSNEDSQPPSSLVEGAMRAHRVSFATPPGSLPTIPTSPCNPSWSATRRPSGKTPQKSKCQKMGISMFLDVAAEEDDEDDDEDEDFSEAQKSAGCLVDMGPSGKSSFSQAIDSMMVRYDGVPQYRGTRVQRLPEGVPLPSMKNVYIVDLFPESAQSFEYEYMKSKGVDATFLPWLPRRLYMVGTCPAEVRNHLPPSHRHATKGIILLPPMEATSLSTFKAQQVLPIRTWVRIKKGLYQGDVGFVETSNAIDVILVVAPRERPYDLPKQCSEKSLFSSELATLAGLALEPILSPAGVGIGFTCGGHDFIHGLLCLTVPAHSVTLVELPHPDDIAFHMITHFERSSVVKAVQLFSAQFWRELDTVKICEGELRGSRGSLIDVEWDKQTASVLFCSAEGQEGDIGNKGETIHCSIQELRRVFSTGDTVRVIAGPYRGHVGHVITAYDGIISLQYDGQSPNLEVSNLLLETHTPDHIRSLTTNHHTDIRMRLPETADSVLPSDTAVVCQGTYKGAEAPIEWMDTDGTQAWIYVKENQDTSSAPANTGSTSTQPDQQLGYVIVPINIHDIRVHRAARTITFSKEKGFDICVGDDIEVVRGKWFRSTGMVQAVRFDEACLDFMCDTYGSKISVPITFCRKVAEHSGMQLSRWVGRDVWVICGEKKGYQGTLRSIGRGVSCVALQGQLVQLRNNQIATPTGLVFDGTILSLGAVQELQHRSTVPVVHSTTPPPLIPPPLEEDPSVTTSDAWTVTAEDLSPAPDYGMSAIFQHLLFPN